MKRLHVFLILLSVGPWYVLWGQKLVSMDHITVIESAESLLHPFSGGLNQPQFSTIDFDLDGTLDLFVFDRAGNAVLPYRYNAANEVYEYQPALKAAIPETDKWALMADYNCDGKADLFCASGNNNGIRVYENTSTAENLSFQLVEDLLMGTNGSPVFVATTDIPALIDVDEDGDLDILAFDPGGLYVRWYERIGNGTCLTLDYQIAADCWGGFMEGGLNNDIFLEITCKGNTGNGDNGGAHSGSSVCAFDQNGDGDKELILGDLNHNNLVYIQNGGSPVSADMDLVDNQFPNYNQPADIFIFPAAFALDIDHDGLDDLLAAPNAANTAINFENVWYYQNTGSPTNYQFSLQSRSWLSDQMVDCGENSVPVFFDYNADGLIDLVIGNYQYLSTPNQGRSSLTLYQNVGTEAQPAFELVSRNWLDVSNYFNPPLFAVYPAFGDMDNDGDEDMMIGDLDGKLHFFENTAGPGNPATFLLMGPDYFGLDVGQQASPQIIDVNRDGLADLLVGEQSGNLNYFENTGSIGQPDFGPTNGNSTNMFGYVDVMPNCCTGFSTPFMFENEQGQYELLVGTEFGYVEHYGNVESNLTDTFELIFNNFGDLEEGSNISIHAADIDQDSLLEWVVGNRRGGINIYDDLDKATEIHPGVPIKQYTLNLYPNPGWNTTLDINFPPFYYREVRIRIFSMDGKICFQETQSLRGSHHKVDLPKGLAQGMYLIDLLIDQQFHESLKWIVE